MKQQTDQKKYALLARQTAAEGCVLLKNDSGALPLQKGDHIAVFGRSAWNYYKSGLGSGGMVNTAYVVSILDALQKLPEITLEESVLEACREWIRSNPVDEGHGWGTVPWSQQEMPVTDDLVRMAQDGNCTAALVIIGRTAGEDQDNSAEPGSYLLTETEEQMIQKVSSAFKRTTVLLNTGNIIDMKWVKKYHPAAVMYVWQGGQEGGNGVADVLTGRVNPCGKLTDTIARDISDYPADQNFGDPKKNYYKEDIYVGYRYFETLASDRVLYPFGYGLSYTEFQTEAMFEFDFQDEIRVRVCVKNIGKRPGKEVTQIYIRLPQGRLGKPARVLAGFYKTPELQPGESIDVMVSCKKIYFASFDDLGEAGHPGCMLLEAGRYEVYAGTDIRNAVYAGGWGQDLQVLGKCTPACAPPEAFTRLKVFTAQDGEYQAVYESVPEEMPRSDEEDPERDGQQIPYTGDCGYQLRDVADGKITLQQFIGQLSDEDLIGLFHGEGMCSSKVTPGTAGAFGGVTKHLSELGIPVACCADGPSGIRMDCGTQAFSLPNGTALGCSFNTELAEQLFTCLGQELYGNGIDVLLGPGINIHRHPLNGRNFEYVSEDPLLTGKMAAAQIRGLAQGKVFGTLKHFCANNQEGNRTKIDAVVSQRALREIYLKGFEIAVKEGGAGSVMTTYGSVNGYWTAGNRDLNSVILRKDWGFEGIVMTDWWGTANWKGQKDDKTVRAPMVIAQNDLYMCCADAEKELQKDDVLKMLQQGVVKRWELQRNAADILQFILKTPAMETLLHPEKRAARQEMTGNAAAAGQVNVFHVIPEEQPEIIFNGEAARDLWEADGNWGIQVSREGDYNLELVYRTESVEQAQIAVSVYIDNIYRKMISLRGTNGRQVQIREFLLMLSEGNHYVRLAHREKDVAVSRLCIYGQRKR